MLQTRWKRTLFLKIMTISYDELMDYGPSVIDSLEKVNDFVNK